MQCVREFAHVFWRQNKTVHFRIFNVRNMQCVQWWYDNTSGTFKVGQGVDITDQIQFDGSLVLIENTLECEVELPPLPVFNPPPDCSEELAQLSADTRDLLRASETRQQLLRLCEDGTSSAQLERGLRLHRAKHKIKAVTQFQKIRRSSPENIDL